MTKVAKKDDKKIKKNVKTEKNEKIEKKEKKEKKEKIISEHYDLPPTYNKTFIVLLFQSPKTLFSFWEISNADKANLLEKYGSHFFDNTRPILHITNKTNNSCFDIEINDYATNWYIDVDNADCEYEIQLGRKPYNSIGNDFIIIANSNLLTSPNDHILLEKLPKSFQFLNIKNNKTTTKKIDSTSFSEIYNTYNYYEEIYNDELFNNPSSK